FFADLRRNRARFGEMLGTGNFRRFAEHAMDTLGDELVIHVADGRAGGEPGRCVALAALGRDPEFGKVALLALQFGGLLQIILCGACRLGDGVDVAVELYAEAGYRLAGLGNPVDDALRPPILNADHDAGRNIGICARADDGAEKSFEIFAELQPAIGMRNCQRALDVIADRFARGVRQIVERQDHNMVSYANATVFAPPPHEFHVRLSVTLRHVTTAWS